MFSHAFEHSVIFADFIQLCATNIVFVFIRYLNSNSVHRTIIVNKQLDILYYVNNTMFCVRSA